MYKNVFYFDYINHIGGVETFFWELAKKYHKDFDITVFYRTANEAQVQRLKKYVRCVQWNGEEVECENAFFNYAIEPFIDHITAKIYTQIVHADFLLQKNLTPHVHPKIDRYFGVSQRVCDSFYEVTGIKCELCPNPLTLEEIKNPPLFICGAQRMTSEKGGERIKELVRRLDMDLEIKYYLLIFTNDTRNIITSPNVRLMDYRLDIRPFIYGCDLFLAVSDSEGRCYSVGEKLGYGTGKLLITPCPSFFEQGADEKNSIVLDFDMGNMDDVIEQIRKYYRSRKAKQTFKPIVNEDWWDRYLAEGKPTYEGFKMYRVKATDVYEKENVFDIKLNCIPKAGTEFIIDGDRLDFLQHYSLGCLVEVVSEIG